MPKQPIRFVGCGFKPSDKVAAMLEPEISFEAQIALILPMVKMDEVAFRGLKLHHVTPEKKIGASLHLTDTPAVLGDSKWVWLVAPPGSAPPVRMPSKTATAPSASDVEAASVLPPPPPRPGVKSTGIPAPPPPRPVSPAPHVEPTDDATGAVPSPPPPRPGAKSTGIPAHAEPTDDATGAVPPPPPPRPGVKSTGIPAPPPPRPVSPAPHAEPTDDATGAVSPPPRPGVKSTSIPAPSPPRPVSPAPHAAGVVPTQRIPRPKPAERHEDGAPSITLTVPHYDGDTASIADESAISHAVEEKMQAFHRQLLDDERRKVEALEAQVARTLTRETTSLRAAVEMSWEEQRNRMLQQQNAAAAEQAQFLQTLVSRENEVHEAQAKLIAEYQKKATAAAVGNPAIEDLRLTNAELRDALARREQLAKQEADRAAGEVTNVVKVQAQLLAAMNELHRQSTGTAAVAERVLSSTGHTTLDPVDVASQEALVSFMASVGLGKYLPAMQQHDVDFAALRKMSEADLIAVGINTLGARKKILLELQRLDVREAADVDPGAANSKEAKLLAATGGPSTFTTTEFRRHEKILKRFFEKVGESQLAPRSEAILRQFSRQLDALYSALCHRYEIMLSPYRPAMVAVLRREGLHYLLPAVDVILYAFEGREAEFAEVVVLEQLKQTPQALTWLVFRASSDESPSSGTRTPPPRRGRSRASSMAHNSPAAARQTPVPGDAAEYYYCALVDMSQWELPRIGTRGPLSRVDEPAWRSVPHSGGRLLERNPLVDDLLPAQSSNHRYIAAVVALLMRKDPSRLTQFDALRRQYSGSRDIEFERGLATERPDAPFNARGLYLDLRTWYATHQDTVS